LQEFVCFEAAVVQDFRSDVSLLLTLCFFLHFFLLFLSCSPRALCVAWIRGPFHNEMKTCYSHTILCGICR
jgi:hypothetical protein